MIVKVFPLFLFFLFFGLCFSEQLSISAFNLRILGPTKINNQPIVDKLLDIIQRYDLILLQEIKDISEEAPNELLRQLNERMDDNNQYIMLLGPRVGRSPQSTEQYAYFYKEELFIVLNSYSYNDISDVFSRDPFIAQFQIISSGSTFGCIGLHTPPSDTVNELSALPSVQEEASIILNEPNIVLFGDFNADSPNLSLSELDQLQIFNDPDNYISLISRNIDTTTADSASDPTAYDRIVITNTFDSFIVPLSATAFNFADAFGLSTEDAFDVSDHYPVEFKLDTNGGQTWTTIYSENFNNVIGSEWSNSITTTSNGHTFLGQFGEDQSVQVIIPFTNLPNPASNFEYRILVLFHAIGSWNGSPPAGPDTWKIELNSQELYHGIFCNSMALGSNDRQSYPTDSFPIKNNRCGTGSLPYDLSFSQYFTYSMEFRFFYTGSEDLTFTFSGLLLATDGFEPISAESWGIDDFKLESTPNDPLTSESSTVTMMPSIPQSASMILSNTISPSPSFSVPPSESNIVSPSSSKSLGASISDTPSTSEILSPSSSKSTGATSSNTPSSSVFVEQSITRTTTPSSSKSIGSSNSRTSSVTATLSQVPSPSLVNSITQTRTTSISNSGSIGSTKSTSKSPVIPSHIISTQDTISSSFSFSSLFSTISFSSPEIFSFSSPFTQDDDSTSTGTIIYIPLISLTIISIL